MPNTRAGQNRPRNKQTGAATHQCSGHVEATSSKRISFEFDATIDHRVNGSVASAGFKWGSVMGTKRQERRAMGLAVLFLFAWYGFAQAQKETSKTQIVLLGTGTPAPDPEHSGPSTAIVVNGTAYLVDFGTGVVRQAAAARKKGVRGLEPVNLRIGFLTHLHSDHTLGFPGPDSDALGRGKEGTT